MKYLVLACTLLLAGCEERFRYECQNPKHWERSDCVRPMCAINGVCPDQLNKPTDMKMENEK